MDVCNSVSTLLWARSAHCHKVDVEFNRTLKIITGTVRTAQMQLLPILANIVSPHLCRRNTQKDRFKNNKLQSFLYILTSHEHSSKRLKSRILGFKLPIVVWAILNGIIHVQLLNAHIGNVKSPLNDYGMQQTP